ncbi:Rac GTPase-activating protein 1 [Strongyloides ratti]|uniref:Rac GTPase-activating protein 1 n=1 Tax=Strongyloides ratti TaxID=34506 RepID=A0A090MU81_STRRB|nr:Rac GTPase-activating protein 1 [Strongyloides ratti]CEF62053.1 Rac GTPase-activating protein 1 [Strongyloides ratti]
MDSKNSCHLINSFNLLLGEMDELVNGSDIVYHELLELFKKLFSKYQTLEQTNQMLQIKLKLKEKSVVAIGKKLLTKDVQLTDSCNEVRILEIRKKELETKIEKLFEIVNLLKITSNTNTISSSISLEHSSILQKEIKSNKNSSSRRRASINCVNVSILSSDICTDNLNSITSQLHSSQNVTSEVDKANSSESPVNFPKESYMSFDNKVIHNFNSTNRVSISCVQKYPPYNYKSKGKMTLFDISPQYSPMIPYIIISCIEGLEKFHLETEELYQLPILYKEVSELYNNFLYSKSIPALEFINPSTIIGCLQKFLRAISDPIIPHVLWIEFDSAIKTLNVDNLISVIKLLPEPNLQTLAYLCLHWIKVSEKCYSNKKLAIYNIADIFGPTIVGFNTSPGIITSSQMKKEMESQKLIILGFLQLSNTFWEQFLPKEINHVVYN